MPRRSFMQDARVKTSTLRNASLLVLLVGCADLGAEAEGPNDLSNGKGDAPSGLSAIRGADESFEDALARYQGVLRRDLLGDSAMDNPVPLGEIDFSAVPEWTQEKLDQDFAYLRDTRLLTATTGSLPTRRLSWLYPDDGCWLRAEEMNNHLASHESQRTNKIFIYGELHVVTDNSPFGEVNWWFHVVPVARVGEAVYALDPAIDPRMPLPIADWIARQSTVEAAKLKLCSSFAFWPDSACDQTSHTPPASTDSDMQFYLSREWNRQVQLGRNPIDVLGEHPPWLMPQ